MPNKKYLCVATERMMISKTQIISLTRLDAIPSNAKMLSNEIQNDLLDAACTLLLRRIKRELHEGSFYAILADKCKDVSKKQLVAVC